MNEALLRNEIGRMLAYYGYEHYHPEDSRMTQIGRPDLYSMNPTGSFVIEVKLIEEKSRVETWFHPKIISNGQRNWLDRWFTRGGRGYIAIGTKGGKKRRLWVMPWERWTNFEHLWVADKDTPRVLISELEGAFGDCECRWVTLQDKSYPNSSWRLPEGHEILKSFAGRPIKQEDWAVLSLRFEDEK